MPVLTFLPQTSIAPALAQDGASGPTTTVILLDSGHDMLAPSSLIANIVYIPHIRSALFLTSGLLVSGITMYSFYKAFCSVKYDLFSVEWYKRYFSRVLLLFFSLIAATELTIAIIYLAGGPVS